MAAQKPTGRRVPRRLRCQGDVMSLLLYGYAIRVTVRRRWNRSGEDEAPEAAAQARQTPAMAIPAIRLTPGEAIATLRVRGDLPGRPGFLLARKHSSAVRQCRPHREMLGEEGTECPGERLKPTTTPPRQRALPESEIAFHMSRLEHPCITFMREVSPARGREMRKPSDSLQDHGITLHRTWVIPPATTTCICHPPRPDARLMLCAQPVRCSEDPSQPKVTDAEGS
ncbi:hypothetical protein CMUS01_05751 [Colletotrichum musicola]|uniref:Uncharacterized protein n=1 Tax=Colletotrichum musicola TaxID=2175873 RepID=A0A8H6KQH0_9PEZI|nr:hypothetical protein CMUS01_05751 [Colletotrichum musicola]